MDRFDKLQATLDAIRLPRAHTKYFPVRDIATAIVGQESKEELGLDEDVEMMGGAAPEWFPGTHATIDMLVELVFNKYVMETPVYREMTRLMEQRRKVLTDFIGEAEIAALQSITPL